MSKADLIADVASHAGINRTQAARAIDSITSAVTQAALRGEEFRLPGVGTFSVGSRAARKGRNPRTGAEIDIAASKHVKFRAVSGLNEAINS